MVIIAYTTIVLDRTGNKAGDIKTNSAWMAYIDGQDRNQTTPTVSTPITIIEPALTIEKILQSPQTQNQKSQNQKKRKKTTQMS